MELSQIGLLLAKREPTPGVDAAPDATNNNIAFARGLVPTEPAGESIDRPIMDADFDIAAGVISGPHIFFKFRCEIRGNRTDGSATDISSGSSANAIPIDVLLRACDLAATYTAESSGGARDGFVIYTPTIPAGEGDTLTIYAYSQGKLYKGTGCKGKIDAVLLEAGKFGFIDFTFMGKWNDVTDSVIPASPVFVATKPQLWQKKQHCAAVNVTADATANTIALANANTKLNNWDRVKFGGTPPAPLVAGTWYYARDVVSGTLKVASTLGGALIDLTSAGSGVTLTSAPGLLFGNWDGSVVQKVNFNLGQVLVPRPDGCAENGIRGFMITGRDSGGEFDPESVQEATHPFWADWKNAVVKGMTLAVGDPNTSGNRYLIEALVQPKSISYEDRTGKRIKNVQFGLRKDSPGGTAGSTFKMLFH